MTLTRLPICNKKIRFLCTILKNERNLGHFCVFVGNYNIIPNTIFFSISGMSCPQTNFASGKRSCSHTLESVIYVTNEIYISSKEMRPK